MSRALFNFAGPRPLGRRTLRAALLFAAAGAIVSPAAAQDTPAPAAAPVKRYPARTVNFPSIAIGDLVGCPADSENDRDCRLIGAAQGAVDVPEGTRLSLRMPQFGVGNLALTANLRADDLWEVNLTFLQLGPDDLRHVSRLTGLESLILTRTNVTDAGLAHVARLTHLKRIDLRQVESLTDTGLDALASLPLESVNLHGTRITNAGVERLAAIPTLREISLAFAPVDDNCLPALARLPRLERLAFFRGVSDRGAGILKTFPALKRLDLLEADPVTNEGLRQLTQSPTLEELNLKSVNITDAGLGPVADAPRLKTLFLMSTQVTAPALSQLRARRPDLRIYW